MQIAVRARAGSEDFDETLDSRAAGRRRPDLARAVESVAARLGVVKAIDGMLRNFEALPAGVVNGVLAERIAAFLSLADEVLDRLEAVDPAAARTS